MALYFIRNGYPPVVFQKIQRLEYALALFQSQTMKEPAPLYSMILENVFNILMNNQNACSEVIVVGREYTFASDIYSIAILMWEISSGQTPFINYEHDYNLAINIIDGIRPEIVSGTPLEYKNLMKKRWDA
uniref:Serine-threonine/tyrosine-protein kinase catalytic domain-containing protein n=1 Tax=Rhizophagus irregularis (strain DAOM 181602 / DAOM 197198 / MUCL 43194) TaxID=747089 RepID=U9TDE2_RHIID